jgi:hypothetical protein
VCLVTAARDLAAGAHFGQFPHVGIWEVQVADILSETRSLRSMRSGQTFSTPLVQHFTGELGKILPPVMGTTVMSFATPL